MHRSSAKWNRARELLVVCGANSACTALSSPAFYCDVFVVVIIQADLFHPPHPPCSFTLEPRQSEE
jgi:hypothetical protein